MDADDIDEVADVIHTKIAQVAHFLNADGSYEMRVSRLKQWMDIDKVATRGELVCALDIAAKLTDDLWRRIKEE